MESPRSEHSQHCTYLSLRKQEFPHSVDEQGHRPPHVRQLESYYGLLNSQDHESQSRRHDLHKMGIDHRVKEQMGSLYGRKDHGDEPRRHDKKTTTMMNCNCGKSTVSCSLNKRSSDFSTSCNCGRAKVFSTAATENLHDPHNRDIDLQNEQQLRNLHDLLSRLDHGDELLQHEKNADDLRWTAAAGQPQFSAPSNEAPVEVPQRACQKPCPKSCTG